eukprot:jgi/Mesvir1/13435/Mv16507-RA.1
MGESAPPDAGGTKGADADVSSELLESLVDAATDQRDASALQKLKEIARADRHGGKGSACAMSRMVLAKMGAASAAPCAAGHVEDGYKQSGLKGHHPQILLSPEAARVAAALLPHMPMELPPGPDSGVHRKPPRRLLGDGLADVLWACSKNRGACSESGVLSLLLAAATSLAHELARHAPSPPAHKALFGSVGQPSSARPTTDVWRSVSYPDLPDGWADLLPVVAAIEAVASHSVSVNDMHDWLKAVKEVSLGPGARATRTVVARMLVDALHRSMVAEEVKGPATTFELDGEYSGLLGAGVSKWPFVTGYAFATWIYVESFVDSPITAAAAAATAAAAVATFACKSSPTTAAAAAATAAGGNSNHMPRLFSFLTAGGAGIEAYFHEQFLVLETLSGKEERAILHFECMFKPRRWYFLGVEHACRDALWSRADSEVRLYVNGQLVESRQLAYPKLSAPLAFCCLGTNPPAAMAGLQRRRRQCALFAELGPIYIFRGPIGPELMNRLAERGPDYLPTYNLLPAGAPAPLQGQATVLSRDVVRNGALDVELGPHLYELYHPLLFHHRSCQDASPFGNAGSMGRRSADALGDVSVSHRKRARDALWALAKGGAAVLLPLLVGTLDAPAMQPLPVATWACASINGSVGSEPSSDALLLHAAVTWDQCCSLVRLLLVTSLNHANQDRHCAMVDTLLELAISSAAHSQLKKQVFQVLLLDLSLWANLCFRAQQRLLTGLASLVHTEAPTMRKAGAVQGLLDGMRRCYWTVTTGTTRTAVAGYSGLAAVTDLGAATVDSSGAGWQRAPLSEFDTSQPRYFCNFFPPSDVRSLVDDIMVVLELLMARAAVEDDVLAGDCRCLLQFLAETPHVHQLAGPLNLLYRQIAQPNASRASAAATMCIQGGLRELLHRLLRAEGERHARAATPSVVDNGDLAAPDMSSTEEDFAAAVGVGAGLADGTRTGTAGVGVATPSASPVDAADEVFVAALHILGALFMGGHVREADMEGFGGRQAGARHGGGGGVGTGLSDYLHSIEHAIRAAPRQLLTERTYETLLGIALSEGCLGFEKPQTRLVFGENPTCLIHAFALLTPVLNCLHLAPPALQERILQDMLLLACVSPENRDAFTAAPDWPGWMLHAICVPRSRLYHRLGDPLGAPITDVLGGTTGSSASSTDDLAGAEGGVRDLGHGSWSTSEMLALDLLVVLLENALYRLNGWKMLEAVLYQADHGRQADGGTGKGSAPGSPVAVSSLDGRIYQRVAFCVRMSLLACLLQFCADGLKGQLQPTPARAQAAPEHRTALLRKMVGLSVPSPSSSAPPSTGSSTATASGAPFTSPFAPPEHPARDGGEGSLAWRRKVLASNALVLLMLAEDFLRATYPATSKPTTAHSSKPGGAHRRWKSATAAVVLAGVPLAVHSAHAGAPTSQHQRKRSDGISLPLPLGNGLVTGGHDYDDDGGDLVELGSPSAMDGANAGARMRADNEAGAHEEQAPLQSLEEAYCQPGGGEDAIDLGTGIRLSIRGDGARGGPEGREGAAASDGALSYASGRGGRGYSWLEYDDFPGSLPSYGRVAAQTPERLASSTDASSGVSGCGGDGGSSRSLRRSTSFHAGLRAGQIQRSTSFSAQRRVSLPGVPISALPGGAPGTEDGPSSAKGVRELTGRAEPDAEDGRCAVPGAGMGAGSVITPPYSGGISRSGSASSVLSASAARDGRHSPHVALELLALLRVCGQLVAAVANLGKTNVPGLGDVGQQAQAHVAGPPVTSPTHAASAVRRSLKAEGESELRRSGGSLVGHSVDATSGTAAQAGDGNAAGRWVMAALRRQDSAWLPDAAPLFGSEDVHRLVMFRLVLVWVREEVEEERARVVCASAGQGGASMAGFGHDGEVAGGGLTGSMGSLGSLSSMGDRSGQGAPTSAPGAPPRPFLQVLQEGETLLWRLMEPLLSGDTRSASAAAASHHYAVLMAVILNTELSFASVAAGVVDGGHGANKRRMSQVGSSLEAGSIGDLVGWDLKRGSSHRDAAAAADRGDITRSSSVPAPGLGAGASAVGEGNPWREYSAVLVRILALLLQRRQGLLSWDAEGQVAQGEWLASAKASSMHELLSQQPLQEMEHLMLSAAWCTAFSPVRVSPSLLAAHNFSREWHKRRAMLERRHKDHVDEQIARWGAWEHNTGASSVVAMRADAMLLAELQRLTRAAAVDAYASGVVAKKWRSLMRRLLEEGCLFADVLLHGNTKGSPPFAWMVDTMETPCRERFRLKRTYKGSVQVHKASEATAAGRDPEVVVSSRGQVADWAASPRVSGVAAGSGRTPHNWDVAGMEALVPAIPPLSLDDGTGSAAGDVAAPGAEEGAAMDDHNTSAESEAVPGAPATAASSDHEALPGAPPAVAAPASTVAHAPHPYAPVGGAAFLANPSAFARLGLQPEEAVLVDIPALLVTPLKTVQGRIKISTQFISFVTEDSARGSAGDSNDGALSNMGVGTPTVAGRSTDEEAGGHVPTGDAADWVVVPPPSPHKEPGDGVGRVMYGKDKKWPVASLWEVYNRRYLLRKSALELFFVDRSNFFFNFPDESARKKVFQVIRELRPPMVKPVFFSSQSPSRLLQKMQLTERWVKREISNFEYLTHLNTLAGRTYNDATQYPVFPWVLRDYESAVLDLNNPDVFRDLSKPVGALEPTRLAKFRERYELFDDPSIPKFHYGSHYSSGGTVLYYLLRLEPYTSAAVSLQGGTFDHADRMFDDIASTWKGVLSDMSDVKELVPEFFFCPEFLLNVNNVDFGRKQNGEPLGKVKLPPWAKDAGDFIAQHRAALESEYVSEHLDEWIDLIFGYKQRGPEAAAADNVFYYLTYEGAVDITAIDDPVVLKATQDQIAYFGQTPSQLLSRKHPKRLPASECVLPLFFGMPKVQAYLLIAPADASSNPMPALHMRATLANTLLTISRGPPWLVSSHAWLANMPDGKGRPFHFSPDRGSAGRTGDKLFRAFRKSSPDDYPRLALAFPRGIEEAACLDSTPDGRYILTGGHMDGSVRVFQVAAAKCKLADCVQAHCAPVRCLAVSRCGSVLVTGSADATAMVWRLHLPSVTKGGGAQRAAAAEDKAAPSLASSSAVLLAAVGKRGPGGMGMLEDEAGGAGSGAPAAPTGGDGSRNPSGGGWLHDATASDGPRADASGNVPSHFHRSGSFSGGHRPAPPTSSGGGGLAGASGGGPPPSATRRSHLLEGPVHVLHGHREPLSCVALSTELDLVVSCSLTGRCMLHSMISGRLIRALDGVCGQKVQLSSRGLVIVYEEARHGIRTFNVNGLPLAARPLPSCFGDLVTMMASADGGFLVVAAHANQLAAASSSAASTDSESESVSKRGGSKHKQGHGHGNGHEHGRAHGRAQGQGHGQSHHKKEHGGAGAAGARHSRGGPVLSPSTCSIVGVFRLGSLELLYQFEMDRRVSAVALTHDNTCMLVSRADGTLQVLTDPSVSVKLIDQMLKLGWEQSGLLSFV